MSEYVDFKRGFEIEWLELNLLNTNRPMSKSLIISLAPDIDETEIDSLFKEMRFRASQLAKPYFSIESNIISPLVAREEIPEYYLCIYYSFYGAANSPVGTKLFENISAQALKNFIGGEVYALGFPAGKGLNSYLDEISKLCFESRGRRSDGTYKDDGVDVIGYKLFGDNRSSNIYVLLQCAAGIHWKQKKKIETGRWTKYIYWYDENIISSISTVDYVSKEDWEKQASSFGLLFDRTRIYNSLYSKPVLNELRDSVLNWVGSI
jgi:hypothetical protein